MKLPSLESCAMDVLLLVVPDTRYNESVPVLVGTNVLRPAFESSSSSVNQTMSTSWNLAFQSLRCQMNIESRGEKLGKVTATKSITVPAGERRIIHGITRAVAASCMRMSVLTEEAEHLPLPGGLILSPGFHHLQAGKSMCRVPVEVTNYSEQPVIIPAKSTLCELHQAQIVPPTQKEAEPEEEFQERFHSMLEEHLTETQVQEVKSLLVKWRSVFSQHDLDLGAQVWFNITLNSLMTSHSSREPTGFHLI